MNPTPRCAMCGKLVNMEEDERLVVWDFSEEDPEYTEAVADAVVCSAEEPADYELAELLREQPELHAHGECVDGSALDRLAVTAEEVGL